MHLMGPPALLAWSSPLCLRLVPCHHLLEDSFPDRRVVRVRGLWFPDLRLFGFVQNSGQRTNWSSGVCDRRPEFGCWLLWFPQRLPSSCLFPICWNLSVFLAGSILLVYSDKCNKEKNISNRIKSFCMCFSRFSGRRVLNWGAWKGFHQAERCHTDRSSWGFHVQHSHLLPLVASF